MRRMDLLAMTTNTPSHLLMMLNWMSPTFPIGSFAYSSGLEQAINAGKVRSPGDLEGWIKDMLEVGTAWNDAVLFARCWQDNTAHLNEIAQAMAGSAERYQETMDLGRNFWEAARIWFDNLMPASNMAYPVAAGSACAAAGLVANEALLAFLQNFVATQVSVAVRMGSLGQSKGLEIMKNLAPVIERVADRASKAGLKDLGSSTIGADMASMMHENMYSRIFRT
jgi:urease accessory protein